MPFFSFDIGRQGHLTILFESVQKCLGRHLKIQKPAFCIVFAKQACGEFCVALSLRDCSFTLPLSVKTTEGTKLNELSILQSPTTLQQSLPDPVLRFLHE